MELLLVINDCFLVVGGCYSYAIFETINGRMFFPLAVHSPLPPPPRLSSAMIDSRKTCCS